MLSFATSQKSLLQINTGSHGLQVPGTVAKFSDLVIGYSLPPVAIAFLNFGDFSQNYAFGDVTKLQNAGLPIGGTESNGLSDIFVNKGYCGKRSGAPLYHLKKYSVLLPTNFEQNLFKNIDSIPIRSKNKIAMIYY